MSDTSTQILDTAERLITQGGFHAFSFQDIAERIGIKKASIYYHHPAKAALGREVIARYRARFREVLAAIDSAEPIDYGDALSLYLAPIIQLSQSDDGVCLCGVLGGEYIALPEEMQAEVGAFFEEHQTWLAGLLERGRAAGAFGFTGSAAKMAKLMFSAVEGALIIKRATGDDRQFDDVISVLQDLLRP